MATAQEAEVKPAGEDMARTPSLPGLTFSVGMAIAGGGGFSRTPSAARLSFSTKQVKGLSVDQVRESLLGYLPGCEDFVIDNVIRPLSISNDDFTKLRHLFDKNLQKGLSKDTHDKAQVRMYTTYVREVPDGSEKGNFLALDLSSRHFRILLVSLDGSEEPKTECSHFGIPDKLLHGKGTALFDFIAGCFHRFLKKMDMLNSPEPIPLGFTFSFPCKQTALNKATLATWTKHFNCEGVVGEDVVGLLDDAIKRKKDMNIDCNAIINDTVGTLMSGAIEDGKCSIGLILAAGTNACYIESLDKVETWDGDHDDPKQVIIDTEWHGFGNDGCLDFIRSDYDMEIDRHSLHKGDAIYEKMISTMFLGELVRLVIEKLKDHAVLFDDHWTEEMGIRGRFYTKYVSEILQEEDIRFTRTRHVLDELGHGEASETECRVLHNICQLVSIRAAHLTALGLACLMDRMGKKEVGIAVDGALYRFNPLFSILLTEKIPQFLKQETKFWFVPSNDGAGKGAAIVAAVAQRINNYG